MKISTLFLSIIGLLTTVNVAFAVNYQTYAEINDPSNINTPTVESYNSNYRNTKRVKEHANNAVISSDTLARTAKIKTDNSADAKIDNLEASISELVQKLEDDRIKKSNEQTKTLKTIQQNITKTYKDTGTIDVDRLGYETDPKVAIPFKCKNPKPESCNSENDDYSIKSCDNDEYLTWDGSAWKCHKIFKNL